MLTALPPGFAATRTALHRRRRGGAQARARARHRPLRPARAARRLRHRAVRRRHAAARRRHRARRPRRHRRSPASRSRVPLTPTPAAALGEFLRLRLLGLLEELRAELARRKTLAGAALARALRPRRRYRLWTARGSAPTTARRPATRGTPAVPLRRTLERTNPRARSGTRSGLQRRRAPPRIQAARRRPTQRRTAALDFFRARRDDLLTREAYDGPAMVEVMTDPELDLTGAGVVFNRWVKYAPGPDGSRPAQPDVRGVGGPDAAVDPDAVAHRGGGHREPARRAVRRSACRRSHGT